MQQQSSCRWEMCVNNSEQLCISTVDMNLTIHHSPNLISIIYFVVLMLSVSPASVSPMGKRQPDRSACFFHSSTSFANPTRYHGTRPVHISRSCHWMFPHFSHSSHEDQRISGNRAARASSLDNYCSTVSPSSRVPRFHSLRSDRPVRVACSVQTSTFSNAILCKRTHCRWVLVGRVD